jgi:hypothetical protein
VDQPVVADNKAMSIHLFGLIYFLCGFGFGCFFGMAWQKRKGHEQNT